MRMATSFLALIAVGLSTLGAAAPIRVLIVDGESGGAYHDWQRITPVLRKMLDETGLFDVAVAIGAPTVAVEINTGPYT